jgi:hypothetical protein
MAPLDEHGTSRDQWSDMTSPPESPKPATPTFRTTLVRVMAVQVGALLLLWLLQSHYTS